MPPRSPRSFPLPRRPRRPGYLLRGVWRFMDQLDGATLRAVLHQAQGQHLYHRAAALAYLALITAAMGGISLALAIATFPRLQVWFTPWVPAPTTGWTWASLLASAIHNPLPANGWLLGLGLIGFSFSAHSTLITLLAGLTPAPAPRPQWRTRLRTGGLTLNTLLWSMAAIALRAFHQGHLPPNPPTGEGLWPGGMLALARFLSAPLALAVLTLAVAWVYRLGPPHHPRHQPWIPGAGLTVLTWWGLVTLPRLYLPPLSALEPRYGAIAAILSLLLGLYLGSMTLLLGAQINQVVGHRLSLRQPPPGSQPRVPPPAFENFTIRRRGGHGP
ncbi:MAG: YhjD/YihY/BrkB family envelope integrity protein [Leptolyngbya sp.]|nr:YhjD/YihY/BrkB family envelope integrity protein [Leptolyngbya sp.]